MAILDVNVDLLYSCSRLGLISLGSFILIIELTSAFFLMLLCSFTFGFYCLIMMYSIKPVSPATVEEIMGADLSQTTSPLESVIKNLVGKTEKDSKFFIKFCAHRFAGLEAPENTMPALVNAVEGGAVMVEFDISLTADGVPILFHDDTIDRTSISEGFVSSWTYDEIIKLDLSVKHPNGHNFRGAHVAAFEEAVEYCMANDVRMIIDVKDSQEKTIKAIIEAYDKHPKMFSRAMVTSFNPFIIYNIRRKRPQIMGAMSWRPYYFSHIYIDMNTLVPRESSPVGHAKNRLLDFINDFGFFNIFYHFLGLSAVLMMKDEVHKDVIKRWRDRGVRVMSWTVNDPYEKVHFARNLRIIYLTDTLASLD